MATLLVHGPPTGRLAAGLRSLAARAFSDVRRPRVAMLLCTAALLLSIAFPSDLDSYRQTPPAGGPLVASVENHLRFVNTAAQILVPIALGDSVGLVQSAYVALASTAATHGLKYLLNPLTVADVRLGERPNHPLSRHNMPSGHSSMASSAAYFVARRYGWWHLLYLLPITLLTMYERVAVDAHTISAVLAGALVGILTAMFFTGTSAGHADH